MSRCNLINSVLCCLNPKMQVTPTHYVCGKNLALFTSFAQIENCLTGFTNNCKCLTSCNTPYLGIRHNQLNQHNQNNEKNNTKN